MSESIPVSLLNCFCLTNPQSITYPTLSTVSDVSAMFVAKMILRQSSGVFMKAFLYCSGDWAPYRVAIIILGTALPLSAISLSFEAQRFYAFSHSSNPVRNTKISPAGSFKWILKAAPTEFSTLLSLLDSLCKILTG